MNIIRTDEGNLVRLALEGRLDTVTSSRLTQELDGVFEQGPQGLIFDFSRLEYISSAGLRVLLNAQKKVNAAGSDMRIVGASETVREIFDITGFSDIMSISG